MNKTILIVEDDPVLRWIMANFIREAQYEISVQSNGLEAMEWLSKGNIPDLIITDYMMPLMNGGELIASLRKSGIFKAIPIILLTAVDNAQSDLANIHADHILNKPFDPQDLIRLITDILNTKSKAIKYA